ncbi:dimethylamine monooxygenase subunit DmmA family protein [Pseudomonas sp. NCHU5208]|uniref:dimethylamine monooxygenase subunit DmmA family protein n=1 Tax=unclassified Pseudomonas TaxID=196821 RepID=UPI003F9EB40F
MTASHSAPLLSTPCYARAVSKQPANQRILVAQQASAAIAPHEELAPARLLCLGEPPMDGPEQEGLPSIEALYLRLQMLLEQAQAGTRLYVIGDESFLWHVQRLARQAGLLGDEIELIRQGVRRRLYCVHCGHFQDIGSEGECTCGQCRVKLFVREHFSQRLGAYMGVCIDPDSPYAAEVQA